MTANRPIIHVVVCFLLAAELVGCSRQHSVETAVLVVSKPEFYTVDHYDKSRDPVADMAMTVERATRENKRIFVQVGGNWCRWCEMLTKFIESNEPVRAALSEGFLVMKVHYSTDHPNEPFLSQYPEIAGYPHVYIFDTDGTILHSQATAELEAGDGYNEEVYLDFLANWAPER